MAHCTWDRAEISDTYTWPEDYKIIGIAQPTDPDNPSLSEVNDIEGLNQIVAEAKRRAWQKSDTLASDINYFPSTKINDGDITSLRTDLNSVRNLFGQSDKSWTVISTSTKVSVEHLTELREALDLQDPNENNKWFFGTGVFDGAYADYVADDDYPSSWNTVKEPDDNIIGCIGDIVYFSKGYSNSDLGGDIIPYNGYETIGEVPFSLLTIPQVSGSNLFSKAGYDLMISVDNGVNWNVVTLPTDSILGSVSYKVNTNSIIRLDSGRILCGGWFYSGANTWTAIWYSDDDGINWDYANWVDGSGDPYYPPTYITPILFEYSGSVFAVVNTTYNLKFESSDNGATWCQDDYTVITGNQFSCINVIKLSSGRLVNVDWDRAGGLGSSKGLRYSDNGFTSSTDCGSGYYALLNSSLRAFRLYNAGGGVYKIQYSDDYSTWSDIFTFPFSSYPEQNLIYSGMLLP